MADTDGYNGWSNYETWAVALWLNNDPGSQDGVHEAVRDARGMKSLNPRYEAMDSVRTHVRQTYLDGAEDELVGMCSDLFGAAVQRIDWYELADSFLSDLADEVADLDDDDDAESEV